MKTKKGISPLIAAVILIAFVIAVAGIVSGFFTGFFKKRQAEISQKGETVVDCGTASFEIDPDTVNFDGTDLSLTVYVEGSSNLKQFNMTVYNQNGTEQVSGASGGFSPGQSVELTGTPDSNAPFDQITVTTTSCSGLSDSIVNETGNTNWIAEELA